MQAVRARVRLALLVGAQASAVVVLHHLGGWEVLALPSLSVATVDEAPAAVLGWLGRTPPGDVLAALSRLVALALAWWLLAATLGYRLAAGRRQAGRWLGALTPAFARRAVDAAVAASVLLGASVSAERLPAAASLLPPGHAPIAASAEEDSGEDEDDPMRLLPPALDPSAWQAGAWAEQEPAGTEEDPAAAPADAAAVELDAAHTVRAGEHLWGIAAARLARARGVEAAALDVGEVAAYWLRVVEAVRPQLRSGDPDLIYPGERLRLPSP